MKIKATIVICTKNEEYRGLILKAMRENKHKIDLAEWDFERALIDEDTKFELLEVGEISMFGIPLVVLKSSIKVSGQLEKPMSLSLIEEKAEMEIKAFLKFADLYAKDMIEAGLGAKSA